MKILPFKGSVVLMLLPIILCCYSCSKNSPAAPVVPPPVVVVPPPVVPDWAALATRGQNSLHVQFWSPTYSYIYSNNNGNTTFQYWWNAHTLDVMVDAFKRTNSATYSQYADLLYKAMATQNNGQYTNNFNDDMEWMTIACLRAYDATSNIEYKNTAEALWAQIIKSWSTVAGGGISWMTTTPNSKNACSNAPGAIIAARLFKLDKDSANLTWAKNIFAWEKATLVDPQTGVVWDNIAVNGGVPTIQTSWTFTYNQGTYIGAATELYSITKDPAYLTEAVRTSSLVIDNINFSPNGILKGEGAGDGGLFKGIYIRYLNELIVSGYLDDATQAKYINFMVACGKSLRDKATLASALGDIYSTDWVSYPSSQYVDTSIELSGLMLFEALAVLEKLNLVTGQ